MPISVKDGAGTTRTISTTDDLIPPVNLIGTRTYNFAAIQRVAVATAAASSTAVTGTEVLVHASTKCYIRIGEPATAATGIPLEAGEKFHFRIATGAVISVIRDTTDGFLTIVPVA